MQEVDGNVVIQKFQAKLAEALSANIFAEARLEAALAEVQRLEALLAEQPIKSDTSL